MCGFPVYGHLCQSNVQHMDTKVEEGEFGVLFMFDGKLDMAVDVFGELIQVLFLENG